MHGGCLLDLDHAESAAAWCTLLLLKYQQDSASLYAGHASPDVQMHCSAEFETRPAHEPIACRLLPQQVLRLLQKLQPEKLPGQLLNLKMPQ